MKKVLTNWKVWAVLFSLAIIFILLTSNIFTVNVERRPYMTLKEYNSIDIGMDYNDFLKVQMAKPSEKVKVISDSKDETDFAATYKGKNEFSYAIIFIKETKNGKKIIYDKKQGGMEDN